MDDEAFRKDCWDRAAQTFGTARIFETRARLLKRNLRLLSFLGIAVPLTVGGVVVSFSANAWGLRFLLTLAGLLSIAQLIVSAWSLAAQWDTGLAYSQESATDNDRLSVQYQKYAKNPPPNAAIRFELLEATNQARVDADGKQVVTDAEKRLGMRLALHRFQRPCICGEIPNPMAPSAVCAVCGSF